MIPEGDEEAGVVMQAEQQLKLQIKTLSQARQKKASVKDTMQQKKMDLSTQCLRVK